MLKSYIIIEKNKEKVFEGEVDLIEIENNEIQLLSYDYLTDKYNIIYKSEITEIKISII